jgi:hypothetical protein
MTSNVFRMHGYRGEHRQYYYLVPVIGEDGDLVEDRYTDSYVRDVNEWYEPSCDDPTTASGNRVNRVCSGICRNVSIFEACVPSHEHISPDKDEGYCPSKCSGQRQDWRAKFAEENKGCCFRIWNVDGLVRVRDGHGGRDGRGGGVLTQVERVPLSSLGKHSALLRKEHDDMVEII